MRCVLAAHALENGAARVLGLFRDIATIAVDDGPAADA
jgi:hypothetical protein